MYLLMRYPSISTWVLAVQTESVESSIGEIVTQIAIFDNLDNFLIFFYNLTFFDNFDNVNDFDNF